MAEPLISLSKGISNGNVEILEKENRKNIIILLKNKSQKVSTEYFKTFFPYHLILFFREEKK